MTKSTKQIKVFLMFLGLTLVFLTQTSSALDKVTLQLWWDHQFQFAGYYAAKWQGTTKKQA